MRQSFEQLTINDLTITIHNSQFTEGSGKGRRAGYRRTGGPGELEMPKEGFPIPAFPKRISVGPVKKENQYNAAARIAVSPSI